MIELSLIIMVLYVGFAWVKTKGLPASISDTFYNLKHNWIFMAVMVVCGFLIMPQWLDVSSENTLFLVFFSCVGLMIVGYFPDFKGSQRLPHMIGAAMSGGLSVVWCMLNGWLVSSVLIFATGCALAYFTNKKVFFVELGCLAAVYYCLLF